jgi:hypothetical protein
MACFVINMSIKQSQRLESKIIKYYTKWKECCVATVCLLIVVVAHKIELGSRWCHVKEGLCQSLFGELFIKSLHFRFVIKYRYFNFLTHAFC